MSTSHLLRRSSALALAAVLALGARATAYETTPSLEPEWIGPELVEAHPGSTYSTVVDVNASADCVGTVTIDGQLRGFYRPARGTPVLLPNEGEFGTVSVVGLTARDAAGDAYVVGMVGSSPNATPGGARRWRVRALTGEVLATETLAPLPGDDVFTPRAVNAAGVVVGYSHASNGPPGWRPARFDPADGAVSALDFPATPAAVSAAGHIAGGGFVMDPQGELLALSPFPDQVTGISLTAVNSAGHVAGSAGRSYTDGAGRFVRNLALHDGAWRLLSLGSPYDVAHDMNESGDVVGEVGFRASLQPVVRVAATRRVHVIDELLAPGHRDGGGVFGVAAINDDGVIGGSGSRGAVLLHPVGPLPAPPTPGDFLAAAHPPTPQRPFNGISLSWVSAGELAVAYRIERRLEGDTEWTVLHPGWSGTTFTDVDVGLGVSYEYALQALGVAGASARTPVTFATSPSEPVDDVAPQVRIVSPADGTFVSGRVRVVVEATDDSGRVEYLDLHAVGQLETRRIAARIRKPTLRARWRTRRMTPGTWVLEAYGSDALGNGGRASVSVFVGLSHTRLRVSSVRLRAARGAAPQGDLQGRIVVRDARKRRVRGETTVIGEWRGPQGFVERFALPTDARGVLVVRRSTNGGSWTLHVVDLVREGATFDAEASAGPAENRAR